MYKRQDPGAIIMAGALLGAGLYQLAGAGAAAGAAYNPMAGAELAFASEAAPIVTATAVPAAELAYPSTQIGAGASVVPNTLQAELAKLGVQTAATMAPATAAPGSFQAALPSLLSAGGTAGVSLLDAARGANALKDLVFKPPQPGQQQQPMVRPQSQFSLPAPQLTEVGLLPLAERYRRSLI